MDGLTRLFSEILSRKAKLIREECEPKEVGKTKDGQPVLGLTPEKVLGLRVADHLEGAVRDLATPDPKK